MTLKELNNLFQVKNPTGEIYHETATTYNVYYISGQKTYIYRAKNLVELGIKLNLIDPETLPEAKERAERKAKAIAESILEGERLRNGEIESDFF